MTVSDFEQKMSEEIFKNVLLTWDEMKKVDESFLRGYYCGMERAIAIYKKIENETL